MKSDELFLRLCADISDGKVGESGDRFFRIREFAEKYNVSLDTASGIFKRLTDEGLITLCGKHYYITNGLVSPSTPYGKILRSTRKNLLGIQISGIDNPFFASLTRQLNYLASECGMQLIILDTLNDEEVERRNLKLFRELGVKGVFLCSAALKNLLPLYKRFVLPIVSLAKKPDLLFCDTVLVDNSHAGVQVARHLIEMGCINFAYIGLRHNQNNDPRFNGFSEELDRCRRGPVHRITVSNEMSDELHGSLNTLLKTAERPLGIFCYHDLLAVETERTIKLSSYKDTRIPQDICIVGFDNLPVTSITVPQLSTVSYRYDRISKCAMECMLSLCERTERGKMGFPEKIGFSEKISFSEKMDFSEIIVPSALIVRQSSRRL
jgi:LacI family transcriptional regulator